MIAGGALCALSISYSPLSFITSRTLTTAPPFQFSRRNGGGIGGRGVCVVAVAYSAAPRHTAKGGGTPAEVPLLVFR